MTDYRYQGFQLWGKQPEMLLVRPTLARRAGWGGNQLEILPAGTIIQCYGRGHDGTNFMANGEASYDAERIEATSASEFYL